MEKHTVICNMCGKEFDRYDLEQGIGLGGRLKYGSIHDGKRYLLDLCCDCFDNILDQCVVSPLEDDGITQPGSEPVSWAVEMPRKTIPAQMTFDPDGKINYGNE